MRTCLPAWAAGVPQREKLLSYSLCDPDCSPESPGSQDSFQSDAKVEQMHCDGMLSGTCEALGLNPSTSPQSATLSLSVLFLPPLFKSQLI